MSSSKRLLCQKQRFADLPLIQEKNRLEEHHCYENMLAESHA